MAAPCSIICGAAAPVSAVSVASSDVVGSASFFSIESAALDPIPENTPSPLTSGGSPLPYVSGDLVNVRHLGGGVMEYTGPVPRVVMIEGAINAQFVNGRPAVGIGIAVAPAESPNSYVFLPESMSIFFSPDATAIVTASTRQAVLLEPGDRFQIFWNDFDDAGLTLAVYTAQIAAS